MSTGAGLGMGLNLSGPEADPAIAANEAIDPDAARSRALSAGPARSEVAFPRGPHARHGLPTPGLLHPDLQVPDGRDPCRPRPARDAGRPARPARGPGAGSEQSRRVDTDLENDLLVRAEADDLGDLKSLHLGEAAVPDLPTLGRRLRRYTQLLEGRSLRVRLVADDRLSYEPAAQIIATCSSAGVASIRLSPPGSTPARSGAAEPGASPRGPAPGPAPSATRPGGSP